MLPCFRGLGLELEVIRGEEVEQEAVVEEGEVEGGIMAAAAAAVVWSHSSETYRPTSTWSTQLQ